MVTKLGMVLTNLEWLLLVNSHNPLITWSCEISTTKISMMTKLSEVFTYNEELSFIKLQDLHGLLISHDILNTLYLHLL